MNEEMLQLVVRIIGIALPISLVITFFYFLIRYSSFALAGSRKKKKLVETAIKKGHVFTGRLAETKRERRRGRGRNEHAYRSFSVGIYEYEYKGKTYRCKLAAEKVKWPQEIELYYLKNPKKATTRESIGTTEIGAGKCFWRWFILLSLFQVLSVF